MKRTVFSALLVLVAVVLSWCVLEGARSLIKGGKPHLSVTYRLLTLANLTGGHGAAEGIYAPSFADGGALAALVPVIRDAGVGIGNVPFPGAKTEAAAVNTEVDGCPVLKPNLDKVAFFLRTNAFNPFDPPTVFHDRGIDLPADLAAFFKNFGTPPASLTTNAGGERVTLPAIQRPGKVLVAGDSIAFGAMVGDAETLASQLQTHDLDRQYINLGVSGSDSHEIICRVEAAAARYESAIDEIIYVYCENDFDPAKPYGRPDQVIAWLRGFAQAQGVAKVTVIYAPYIYTVAPEVTRFRGYVGGLFPNRAAERLELLHLVAEADFRWIDIGKMVRQAVVDEGTQFGFFPLFVDHAHLSAEGLRRLAELYRAG